MRDLSPPAIIKRNHPIVLMRFSCRVVQHVCICAIPPRRLAFNGISSFEIIARISVIISSRKKNSHALIQTKYCIFFECELITQYRRILIRIQTSLLIEKNYCKKSMLYSVKPWGGNYTRFSYIKWKISIIVNHSSGILLKLQECNWSRKTKRFPLANRLFKGN